MKWGKKSSVNKITYDGHVKVVVIFQKNISANCQDPSLVIVSILGYFNAYARNHLNHFFNSVTCSMKMVQIRFNNLLALNMAKRLHLLTQIRKLDKQILLKSMQVVRISFVLCSPEALPHLRNILRKVSGRDEQK